MNTINIYESVLLELLATTIHESLFDKTAIPFSMDTKDWNQLVLIAERHGISGIISTQLKSLPEDCRPDEDQTLDLVSFYLQQESDYKWQKETASKLAAALKRKNIKMLILKGIAFSTYYKNPCMRECSDCDCYLISENDNDDAFEMGNTIARELGGTAEYGTYKHSHIHLDGLLIENHHYLTSFNGTKNGRKIELLLEKIIRNEEGNKISGTELICPSAHFNALFLIEHARGNFMSNGLTLRMIYDWAMFLSVEQNTMDWNLLYRELEECKLRKFTEILTSICSKYLKVKILNEKITFCEDECLVNKVLLDTFRSNEHMEFGESLFRKSMRILKRFPRMWRYRDLANESYPTMVWNTFAFSSYMKRDIHI